MKTLIKIEYKKIWTRLTKVAVFSFIMIITILSILFCISCSVAITDDGELIVGLKVFRQIKKESIDIEGIMDQAYIDNLIVDFNSSKELENHEYLLKFELNKYRFSNYLINFAYYGPKMMSDKLKLDFDFLKSESDFYEQYKKAIIEVIKYNNEKDWFTYTDQQINKLEEKIDEINVPFKVGYNEGLNLLTAQYGLHFKLTLIVIGFSLSSLYSKDSSNGIDELTLSSKFGRKKNMNARLIAGNLFAIMIYMIFIGILLLVNGTILSLEGWNLPIQTLWNSCFYNITAGTGILIMFFKGLIVTILIANLVMFLSMMVRNIKITMAIVVISIGILLNLTHTTNSLQLQLNPIYYATSLPDNYYFMGHVMIPYSIAFLFIALCYFALIRVLMLWNYKKYKLS